METRERVMILGIDALDYDTVRGQGHENLRQLRYKKLAIPPECYKDGQPYSPYCWETILTGRPTEINLGIYENVYRNPVLEYLYKRVGKYLGFIPGKRRVLEAVGFELDTAEKERLTLRGVNTLFNLSEDAEDFNVFSYSNGFIYNPFARVKDDTIRTGRMLKYASVELELFMAWLKNMKKQSHELVMSYTRVLDWYGHFLHGTDVYYGFYSMLDLFVKELSDGFDGTIIIISDHGMKLDDEGVAIHTDTAFYSINKPYGFAPESLTGLYTMVAHLLGLPS